MKESNGLKCHIEVQLQQKHIAYQVFIGIFFIVCCHFVWMRSNCWCKKNYCKHIHTHTWVHVCQNASTMKYVLFFSLFFIVLSTSSHTGMWLYEKQTGYSEWNCLQVTRIRWTMWYSSQMKSKLITSNKNRKKS